MRTYFVFGILLVCIQGCSLNQQYNQTKTFDKIEKQQFLTGKVVDFDIPVMRPVSIEIIDSILFLNNYGTEYFVHRYNLNTKKKMGESVPFGSGPNEMLDARKMQIIDTGVWILDKRQQKMHQYGKQDICFSEIPVPIKNIRFEKFVDQALVLPNGKIIALTVDEADKRFGFFDMQGQLVNANGDYPDDNVFVPPFVKNQSFLCNIVYGKGNKVCLMYKITDLVEIYDWEGNLLSRNHGPDHFFPHLEQQIINDVTKVSVQREQTRDAYFSPVVHEDEIWALYSGKYAQINNADYLIDRIIVFNWDGEPLRRCQ
jgi:hypothetical protein